MRALLELDARYAVNQFRMLLRSPGRLAIWIPYLVLAIGLGGWRLTAPATPATTATTGFEGAFATLAGGAFLTVLGFALAPSRRGQSGFPLDNAEALFCVDAGISPATLTGWLQLRKISGALVRWIATLLLYAGAFAGRRFAAGARTRDRDRHRHRAAAFDARTAGVPPGRTRYGNSIVVAGWALCVAGSLQIFAAGFESSAIRLRRRASRTRSASMRATLCAPCSKAAAARRFSRSRRFR